MWVQRFQLMFVQCNIFLVCASLKHAKSISSHFFIYLVSLLDAILNQQVSQDTDLRLYFEFLK